jgi:transposase
MKKVARMIKNHLDGIVVAMVQRVSNAKAEGTNSVIQRIKYAARGFRNRKRFHTAIYFHCGKLDLYPNGVR